jgi:hypothetical protein
MGREGGPEVCKSLASKSCTQENVDLMQNVHILPVKYRT